MVGRGGRLRKVGEVCRMWVDAVRGAERGQDVETGGEAEYTANREH